MYLEGSNTVEYTPVDAYAVMPMADGIISGGSGGDAIVVQNARFLWSYDPDGAQDDGFINQGWFFNVSYSPLVVYGIDSREKLDTYFESNGDLNLVFQKWQEFVQENADKSYVTTFAFDDVGGHGCVNIG